MKSKFFQLQVPTVHMNGTHGPELLQQVLKAKNALSKALEAIGDAAPNGRDYYPTGTFDKAAAEHRERREAVAKLINQYTELSIEISNQIG